MNIRKTETKLTEPKQNEYKSKQGGLYKKEVNHTITKRILVNTDKRENCTQSRSVTEAIVKVSSY